MCSGCVNSRPKRTRVTVIGNALVKSVADNWHFPSYFWQVPGCCGVEIGTDRQLGPGAASAGALIGRPNPNQLSPEVDLNGEFRLPLR